MNALVTIESLVPATVFAPGGIEQIVAKIEAEVRAEAYDVTTGEGRERIKSVAYKVARSKTALDDMGKELVADIKKQAGAIDADRRTARDRLDALKEEVRGPLTAWEEAEKERVQQHAGSLAAIALPPATATAAEIAAHKERLEILAGRDWQEFGDAAAAQFAEIMPRVVEMRDAAEQRERDAAELEALRREKAERDEQDAKAAWQKAENERMQKAAEEAAECERARAEQQAERDRQRAEQAERDKIEAAARAVEAERQRVAKVKAAQEAAERKRKEDEAHRRKIELAVFDAICAVEGINDVSANLLLAALIDGRIPHVSIKY